jgi:LmbE family N-acetylglucosaminyl deacetylase
VSQGSLVFIHAHPDDEALFTAGTARHYSDLGWRVVLITCTDGRLGLDERVRAGNDPRHNARAVAVTRAGELAASVALLGISRHVTLGYRDSGLADWPQASDDGTFVNTDTVAVARTIAAILDEERAVTVVTYDENGYYGHPDHIKAHEVTRAAIEMSATVDRLYYPVTPRATLEEFTVAAEAAGVSLPLWVLDAGRGTEADEVAVTVDATDLADVKRASIAAHASQVDNADLVTMDDALFRLLFGHEHYRLGWSRSGDAGASHDLMGGDR